MVRIMVQITKRERHSGYEVSWGILVDDEGKSLETQERVVTIQHGETTIRLGQSVVANGRYLPIGTRGLVVALHVPHTKGRTTDVVDCLFEAEMREPILAAMKFKDLNF